MTTTSEVKDPVALKIGVMAGGQLGKMLLQQASEWSVRSMVMDPDPECPSARIADQYVQGDILNYDDVLNFGRQVDVLTFEIENINVDACRQLKKEGVRVIPDPEVIALIQDKGLQKNFYAEAGVPTADYQLYDGPEAIQAAVKAGEISLPFIQKTRRGGYDGRGVLYVGNEAKLNELLPGPALVEEAVAIDREIGVIVIRNEAGEMTCLPPVEMVFNPEANLVEKLISPATLTAVESEELVRVAQTVIESMNMVGVLAVEFFIDKAGRILVNECAPRPHNSGHQTIESVMSSQYEQHLRVLLGLPLGSPQILKPAAMVNLLGEDGFSGPVFYQGLPEVLAVPGVKVHLYGKKETRPFRKMGHVTILGDTVEEASDKADFVLKTLKVISK